MPTLRFHAIDERKLLNVAEAMLQDLMNIYSVPADHINFEVVNSRFIVGGTISEGFPIVEVCAFKRADEIQDTVAKSVCKFLEQAGYAESELYFTFPEPRYYYGNGEHY